jgi:geranylgeranyl diphosphate synthase type II
LEKAGSNVGIAFQIQDDILDVTGDSAVLGKSVGSDEKNEKTTYVSLKGLKESEDEQKRLSEEAVEIVKGLSKDDPFLCDLIEYLITRNK